MEDKITQLGFSFSHKGCPCNGTPRIYIKKTERATYALTVWSKRNTWRLTAKGCTIATGNEDNIAEKINNIFNE